MNSLPVRNLPPHTLTFSTCPLSGDEEWVWLASASSTAPTLTPKLCLSLSDAWLKPVTRRYFFILLFLNVLFICKHLLIGHACQWCWLSVTHSFSNNSNWSSGGGTAHFHLPDTSIFLCFEEENETNTRIPQRWLHLGWHQGATWAAVLVAQYAYTYNWHKQIN